MTWDVGTQIGVPRKNRAQLEQIEQLICDAQEKLGQYREEYLSHRYDKVNGEPADEEAYQEREATLVANIRSLRVQFAAVAQEAGRELGIRLGEAAEWRFIPDRGIFLRTA